jgi:hypothetical protein
VCGPLDPELGHAGGEEIAVRDQRAMPVKADVRNAELAGEELAKRFDWVVPVDGERPGRPIGKVNIQDEGHNSDWRIRRGGGVQGESVREGITRSAHGNAAGVPGPGRRAVPGGGVAGEGGNRGIDGRRVLDRRQIPSL